MKMSILLDKLKTVHWSLPELVKIYMRGTLWQFVHLKRIDNVLYGLQGLYQILIPN